MPHSATRWLVKYGTKPLQPNALDGGVQVGDREVVGRAETTGAAVLYTLAAGKNTDITLRFLRGSPEHDVARAAFGASRAALAIGIMPPTEALQVVDLNSTPHQGWTGDATMKTAPGGSNAESPETVAYVFHYTNVKEA